MVQYKVDWLAFSIKFASEYRPIFFRFVRGIGV